MNAANLNATATNLESANITAINQVVQRIETIQEIPEKHRDWIKAQYSSSEVAHSLHKTHKHDSTGPYGLEVDVHFIGVRKNNTRYTIDCGLNVDIPLPNSPQRPHLGWGVKFNGKRVGPLGHVWVAPGVIKEGRPPPGTYMNEFDFPLLRKKFPQGESVEMTACWKRLPM